MSDFYYSCGDPGSVLSSSRSILASSANSYAKDTAFALSTSSGISSAFGGNEIQIQVTHGSTGSSVTDYHHMLLAWDGLGTNVNGMPCQVALSYPLFSGGQSLDLSQPGWTPIPSGDILDPIQDVIDQVVEALASFLGWSELTKGRHNEGTPPSVRFVQWGVYASGMSIAAHIQAWIPINWPTFPVLSSSSLALQGSPFPPGQSGGSSVDTAGIVTSINQLAFRNYTLSLNNNQTIFSVDGSITD